MYCRKPGVSDATLPASLRGCPLCLEPWLEERGGWGYLDEAGVNRTSTQTFFNIWMVVGPDTWRPFSKQGFLELFEPVTEQNP
jgi:hypothetical protein